MVHFEEESNVEGLKMNLELLDEVKDQEIHKMEEYKEKTKIYFGKKSRVKEYVVGHLIRDTELLC